MYSVEKDNLTEMAKMADLRVGGKSNGGDNGGYMYGDNAFGARKTLI